MIEHLEFILKSERRESFREALQWAIKDIDKRNDNDSQAEWFKVYGFTHFGPEVRNDCNSRCWNASVCTVCGEYKKLLRNDYAPHRDSCTSDCPGYMKDPKPPHLWPDERPHPVG